MTKESWLFVKDVYRRKHSSLRSFFLSDFVFLYLRKLDYYVAKSHCFSYWYSSEMYIEENIRRLRSFFLTLLKETWWLCGKRVIAFLVVFVKDVYSGKHSSLALLFSLSRLERNLTIRWQKSHGFLSKMYIEENIRRLRSFFLSDFVFLYWRKLQRNRHHTCKIVFQERLFAEFYLLF